MKRNDTPRLRPLLSGPGQVQRAPSIDTMNRLPGGAPPLTSKSNYIPGNNMCVRYSGSMLRCSWFSFCPPRPWWPLLLANWPFRAPDFLPPPPPPSAKSNQTFSIQFFTIHNQKVKRSSPKGKKTKEKICDVD